MKDKKTIDYIEMNGILYLKLKPFDEEVNKVYDDLVKQYKDRWNVIEELKQKDRLKWIREMNKNY